MNIPILDAIHGIERETMRLRGDGSFSPISHMELFGNPFADKQITVDFADTQLEFVTSPAATIDQAIAELASITKRALKKLPANEFFWNFSTPPIFTNDIDINVANFDDTAKGRDARAYRENLLLRYGKEQQTWCGVHYNLSFKDRLLDILKERHGLNKTELYLHTTRNFWRYYWLLIDLFGASPKITAAYSYWHENDNYSNKCALVRDLTEEALSIRCSPYGYVSCAQKDMSISYNSITEHIADIKVAMQTPFKVFADLGLSPNTIIQSERELYFPIRLKSNAANPGPSLLDSLATSGIDYLEIRLTDIDPFSPIGVNSSTLKFIHLFLVWCAYQESAPISRADFQIFRQNEETVSLHGLDREKALLNKPKESRRTSRIKIIDSIKELTESSLDETYRDSLRRAYELSEENPIGYSVREEFSSEESMIEHSKKNRTLLNE